MKNIPQGFELIGHVDVDSGTLMIGDPCYLDGGFDYDKWCDQLNFEGNGVLVGPDDFDNEKFGSSTVAFSTLHGDGGYPVYAYFEMRGGERRVSAVLVDTNPEYNDADLFGDEDGLFGNVY